MCITACRTVLLEQHCATCSTVRADQLSLTQLVRSLCGPADLAVQLIPDESVATFVLNARKVSSFGKELPSTMLGFASSGSKPSSKIPGHPRLSGWGPQ